MTCFRAALRLAPVVFLVLGALFAAPAAAQEDREAARAEFEQGRRSFEAGAYREALEHFQEAYRLAPHPNVRVNIANCYDQLDRPIEAIFHFEHFLSEADHPPAAQRREVETAMRRLRERVGSISLQITPDGAQITIDGTEQRRAPVVEPVTVVAGSHTVEVQLEGYAPERQTVVVQGGGTARVALRLRRADAVVASAGTATTGTATSAGTGTGTGSTVATSGTGTTATAGTASTGTATATVSAGATTAGTTETTTTDTSDASTSDQTTVATGADGLDEPQPASGGGLRITTPVIITAAVTGAALLGAVIFGPLALSANDSFEGAVRRSNDPALSPAERAQAVTDGQGAASDARTFAVVTDVMLITAAVGAGVTTALFIIAQGESDESEASASLVPVLGPEVGGLVVSGRF